MWQTGKQSVAEKDQQAKESNSRIPLGTMSQTLRGCRELGLTRGYAMHSRLNTDYRLEHPRVGIYRPSLDYLGFKVHHGNLMRMVGLKVG